MRVTDFVDPAAKTPPLQIRDAIAPDTARDETPLAPFLVADAIDLSIQDGDASDLATIEPVRIVPHPTPEFIDTPPGAPLKTRLTADQDIHGSYLARRRDVLLFGPSVQVYPSGRWQCESRAFGEQYIEMTVGDEYRAMLPGPKPSIIGESPPYRLGLKEIADQIEVLESPLFLATPLEPTNWGRWIATVVPKAADFAVHGAGRQLLCYNALPWQKAFLAWLGVEEARIVPHDPGRTYLCRDLMSVEYSVTNMTISPRERSVYGALRARAQARQSEGRVRAPSGERVFVSRRTISARHNYRVLQNEAALIARLEAMGFDVIEPETLSFDEQVLAFAKARIVVALGGAALYNAVFCPEGTTFITIESSETFLTAHCQLLSSVGLRYGVIVGVQDQTDPAPIHKRWSVDIEAVSRRIETSLALAATHAAPAG